MNVLQQILLLLLGLRRWIFVGVMVSEISVKACRWYGGYRNFASKARLACNSGQDVLNPVQIPICSLINQGLNPLFLFSNCQITNATTQDHQIQAAVIFALHYVA